MAKVLKCADVTGDCLYVVRADSEAEVMRQVAAHARDRHGLEQVPAELAEKARVSIRDD